MHQRCSGIRGKLKKDTKFKCQTFANQQAGIAQECLDTELNGQSIEIVEKLCYLGDTIGAKGRCSCQCYNKDHEERSKFRDLVPLLASRGLTLKGNGNLYSACICSFLLYRSEAWPEFVIRLERNDARMLRWICNVRSEYRIYTEELKY